MDIELECRIKSLKYSIYNKLVVFSICESERLCSKVYGKCTDSNHKNFYYLSSNEIKLSVGYLLFCFLSQHSQETFRLVLSLSVPKNKRIYKKGNIIDVESIVLKLSTVELIYG